MAFKMPERILIATILMLTGLAMILYASSMLWQNSSRLHTVSLRSEGFYPAELTIRQGDRVRFISQVGRNFFWPASDIHPTHKTYPAFDPQQPLARDEAWTFQFTEPGRWTYHDHLSPSSVGVISVKGQGPLVVRDPCQTHPRTIDCWQRKLMSTFQQKGAGAMFDQIKELFEKEPAFAGGCHALVHNVGIQAYQYYLQDENSVIHPKATYCAAGFYHGFMEALLTRTPDPQEAGKFCEDLEKNVASEAPDLGLQCFHGIGHGAIEATVAKEGATGDELGLIKPAVALCEEIAKNEEQLYRCTSGVFNGIANFYIDKEYGLTILQEDPLWFCHLQSSRYRESCYGNMNAAILWHAKNDLGTAVKSLEVIADEKERVSAMRYLVALASLDMVRKSAAQAVGVCQDFQGAMHEACIQGFAHGLLEHGTPTAEYKEALEFCRTPEMNATETQICFRYVLSNLGGWYSQSRVKEICAAVEEQYRPFCLPAIRQ